MKQSWMILTLLAATMAGNAFASGTRTLTNDQLQSADLSKTWSMPAATDNLVGRLSTDTLTNKSMSGASNTFTAIPASSALTGQVGVANGGTGAASLTAGSVVVGAGTSAVSLVAPGTSGNVLSSNGSSWVSAAAPSSAPTLVGSTGSPTLITAAGGVTFSSTNYRTVQFLAGSAAAVTVTATPQIAAGTLVGQVLDLIGESASNTVTLQDGNGLSLNGTIVIGLQSRISLMWDGTVWVEGSRR